MIIAVAGLPGSGKSLYAAWWMAQAFARAGRRLIATNLELTESHPAYRVAVKMDEDYVWDGKKGFWDRLPPAPWTIVVDELDQWFDAQEATQLNRKTSARAYWKQHRKMGHTVMLLVQDISNLYVRIRRQVSELVVCWRDGEGLSPGIFAYLPKSWRQYRRAVYLGPEPFKQQVGVGAMSEAQARVVYGWYKTTQTFGLGGAYRVGGVA